MKKLILSHMNWNCRSFLQKCIEDDGYNIHLAYQNSIHRGCESDSIWEDINLYWDERAREFICNAGTSHISPREFSDDIGYRSFYLDEFTNRFADFKKNLNAIHPLEFKISSNAELSDARGDEIKSEVMQYKQIYLRHNYHENYDPKLIYFRYAKEYLFKYLSRLGYKRSRNVAIKNGDAVSIKIGVDSPTAPEFPLFQFLMYVSIFCKEDKTFAFNIRNFDMLIPGAGSANIVNNSLDVVYAVSYYTELIEYLFRSIEELSN